MLQQRSELFDTKELMEIRKEITRFAMAYKFALEEISTKVNILKEEFRLVHEYNPIEHVITRVKSVDSIISKVEKKGLPLSLDIIKEHIRDIAGIRIICSFVSDIYRISEMIQKQSDIQVVEVKDYINNPKQNGYQSLHIVMKIPVYMSDRKEDVFVEMQIRTIAMEFWASLEHKIYYKYNKRVPKRLMDELLEAALTASELDRKMERINKEINILKECDEDEHFDNKQLEPDKLLKTMITSYQV